MLLLQSLVLRGRAQAGCFLWMGKLGVSKNQGFFVLVWGLGFPAPTFFSKPAEPGCMSRPEVPVQLARSAQTRL